MVLDAIIIQSGFMKSIKGTLLIRQECVIIFVTAVCPLVFSSLCKIWVYTQITDACRCKGGRSEKKQLTHLISNSPQATDAALKSLNLYR